MPSTVQVAAVTVTVLSPPSTVQVSEVTVSAAHVLTTLQVSDIVVMAARPVEPYDVIMLPAGTWTQTGGATVTITSNSFIVPPTVTGTVLVFTTSTGKMATYQALPHTLWVKASSGTIMPLRL